jgi:hypothetical protein
MGLAVVLVLKCASGKVCSEDGRSSDNEENLCENGVEIAVMTAYFGNEGDVRSVCSFILLLYRKTGKTKEAFLPVIYT